MLLSLAEVEGLHSAKQSRTFASKADAGPPWCVPEVMTPFLARLPEADCLSRHTSAGEGLKFVCATRRIKSK